MFIMVCMQTVHIETNYATANTQPTGPLSSSGGKVHTELSEHLPSGPECPAAAATVRDRK